MSKFSKLGRRGAAAVAVAAAAVIGATSMGAGHAEAGKLANGYKKATGVDGEVVQTWRKNESAYALPTVANVPTQRSAELSGTYSAQLSKGVAGNVALKYIVGCQVNVEGLSLGLNGSLSLSAAGVSGSLSLPLTPGQVAVVSVTDKDIDAGGSGAIQVSDYTILLPNCAGYASARSAVKVVAATGYSPKDGTLSGTGSYVQSTLYGQPFSLN